MTPAELDMLIKILLGKVVVLDGRGPLHVITDKQNPQGSLHSLSGDESSILNGVIELGLARCEAAHPGRSPLKREMRLTRRGHGVYADMRALQRTPGYVPQVYCPTSVN